MVLIMYSTISIVLRYIFIIIIYMFIFGIIRMIYLDISRVELPVHAILPPKEPYLLVLNQRDYLPFDTKEFYTLNKKDMTIGRQWGCDISFDDMLLSKKHLRIWYDDDEWNIKDLSSKNGTFLNNEKMDGVFLLDDGDVIKMGRLELQFVLNDG